LNAVTHGFFVKVLDPKDTIYGYRDEYEQLIDDLVEYFEPETHFEQTQVELLAIDHIRLRRVLELENAHFEAPPMEKVKTRAHNYAVIQYGYPEEHQHAMEVLVCIEATVQAGGPLNLAPDDAKAVAVRLAKSLCLPFKRWLEYIPAQAGERPRRKADMSLDTRAAVVRVMLTTDQPVAPQDKRRWLKGLQHAMGCKRCDLDASLERDVIARRMVQEQAEGMQRAARDGSGQAASLKTLGEYETRLRRNIERQLKTLIGLKIARQQWATPKGEEEQFLESIMYPTAKSPGSFFENGVPQALPEAPPHMDAPENEQIALAGEKAGVPPTPAATAHSVTTGDATCPTGTSFPGHVDMPLPGRGAGDQGERVVSPPGGGNPLRDLAAQLGQPGPGNAQVRSRLARVDALPGVA